MTKHLAETLMERHMAFISLSGERGRASSAPMLGYFGLEHYFYGVKYINRKSGPLLDKEHLERI